MRIRMVTKLEEKVSIAQRLMAHVPGLNDSFFSECVQRFVKDPSYEFLVADSEPFTQLSAFGLLGRYTTPPDGGEILAIEALWFEKEELDNQLPVWEFIASQAKGLGCKAICVTDSSTKNPRVLRELHALGLLGDYPVGPEPDVVFQKVGNSVAVYSALRGGPVEDQAFTATCMMIRLLQAPVDLSGSILATDEPLYRGEGRLQVTPYWNCSSLEELSAWVFEHGFPAASTRRFSGTAPEQILHQGYVPRATASLTRSFEVAALYATHGRKRDRGLVFTLETARLRGRGDIFDAYVTMTRCCPWMPHADFETLRCIVTLLGVWEAGLMLSICSDQAKMEQPSTN